MFLSAVLRRIPGPGGFVDTKEIETTRYHYPSLVSLRNSSWEQSSKRKITGPLVATAGICVVPASNPRNHTNKQTNKRPHQTLKNSYKKLLGYKGIYQD
jgi:hypothetical protein